MARTIPDAGQRGEVLAALAVQLADADPKDSALFDQALALTRTIPENWKHGPVLAALAERLADADPEDPALFARALAIAGTISSEWRRSEALAVLAERLANADPNDLALLERALAAAGTIPDDRQRSEALARIHAMTGIGMLDELSRWRFRSFGASIDLLNLSLGHSHDKPIVESISLAVLDVVVEFSPQA